MFDYYAAIGSFRTGPDFLMACLELPLGCIGRACTQWSPGGVPKLAIHWADYEATDCVGFGKASDAVIAKFWVSAYTL
jgi:hypothetical protein